MADKPPVPAAERVLIEDMDDFDGPTLPRTTTPLDMNSNILELEERYASGGIFDEKDIDGMIKDLRIMRSHLDRNLRLTRAAGLAQRTVEEARNIAEARAKMITGEMKAIELVSTACEHELEECRDSLLAARHVTEGLEKDVLALWRALGAVLAQVDTRASTTTAQQRIMREARDLHGCWLFIDTATKPTEV